MSDKPSHTPDVIPSEARDLSAAPAKERSLDKLGMTEGQAAAATHEGQAATSTADKPKTTIFDVLAPSESTRFAEGERPTVTIGGQTFHVINYIGDVKGGAAMLHSEMIEMAPDDIAMRLLFCAANVVVITTDWDHHPDPRPILHNMMRMLGELFKPCHEAHMRTLATRGKPS